MTQISAPIFENAEKFLAENLRDFCTDNVSAIYKTKTYDEHFIATFFDEEEGKSKVLCMVQYVNALVELVNLVSKKKLFVGGVTNPVDLTDPCNWDAEVVDAFYQLAFHGKIIYG